MFEPEDPAPATPAPDLRLKRLTDRHRWMLSLAVFTLAAAWILRVQGGERVALVWPLPFLIPPSCYLREYFGLACPGCGLTRSFVHLAHGDVEGSLAMHRLGWLIAGLLWGQIPYRIYALRDPLRNTLPRWLTTSIGWVVITLLIGNWLLGLWQSRGAGLQ